MPSWNISCSQFLVFPFLLVSGAEAKASLWAWYLCLSIYYLHPPPPPPSALAVSASFHSPNPPTSWYHRAAVLALWNMSTQPVFRWDYNFNFHYLKCSVPQDPLDHIGLEEQILDKANSGNRYHMWDVEYKAFESLCVIQTVAIMAKTCQQGRLRFVSYKLRGKLPVELRSPLFHNPISEMAGNAV